MPCPRTHNLPGARTVKSSILIFLALLALSPVLRTLTAATSSDSIWALSAFLFALNVVLADYTPMHAGQQHPRERCAPPRRDTCCGVADTEAPRLTSVMSVNAAISASVVLASRLVDDISVFALTLFAIEAFALFPLLRRRLQVGPHHQAGIFFLVFLSHAADRAVSLPRPHPPRRGPRGIAYGSARTHRGDSVRRRLRICHARRAVSASVGTAVQKVRRASSTCPISALTRSWF